MAAAETVAYPLEFPDPADPRFSSSERVGLRGLIDALQKGYCVRCHSRRGGASKEKLRAFYEREYGVTYSEELLAVIAHLYIAHTAECPYYKAVQRANARVVREKIPGTVRVEVEVPVEEVPAADG